MSKRILVLDDDPDLLNIMDILLAECGYDILALANGEMITDHIERFQPDLILIQVMLAGLDGAHVVPSH